MKKVVTVFTRNRYVSNADGASQRYQIPTGLMSTLGGSVAIRLELTLYARSANAQILLTTYEGTKQDARPCLNNFSGKIVTGPTTYTGIGITYADITSSYSGLIDLLMEVKAGEGSAQEWVDAEIRATLTYN